MRIGQQKQHVHFKTCLFRQAARIPHLILDGLTAYDRPGNVRELENVLERAIILSPGTLQRREAIYLGSAAPAKARERQAQRDTAAGAGESDTLQARKRSTHRPHLPGNRPEDQRPGWRSEQAGSQPQHPLPAHEETGHPAPGGAVMLCECSC
jgi:transcriptional regulator with GAF, ATPase, and Fis domain